MNMKSRVRNAVHIKQKSRHIDQVSGSGITLVRVFGADEKIVESTALVERQDHTVKNCIKEIVLVTVQERTK